MASILHTTLQRLEIREVEGSEEVVKRILETITDHLKENSQSFRGVGPWLGIGSDYENLKISNPDEVDQFEVMLPVPVEQVEVHPFGFDGAFYSLKLQGGESPLDEFKTATGTLSAGLMLQEFRDEVEKSIRKSTEWWMPRKKKGYPAVTLTTTRPTTPISLDIVLAVVVSCRLPGIKGKRKPYYLVPKYKGFGMAEHGGVLAKDAWCMSFSHLEKGMLLNRVQRDVLQVQSRRTFWIACLEHLLVLLKEQDSALTTLGSYHAQTALLHACCSRTRDGDWGAAGLSRCFLLLLQDFRTCLRNGVLQNFFIPTQNLFSGIGQETCSRLAQQIQEQWDDDFPIFQ